MLRTLLVPLDGSPLAERVLPTAAALARSSGATLDLVRVHRPQVYGDLAEAARWDATARLDAGRYLELVAARLAAKYDVRTTFAVLEEPVVAAVIRRAAAVGADLIVMATHGRTGINRAWLGSVADGVVREAMLPVLLLRSEPSTAALGADMSRETGWMVESPAPLRRIAVAVDGSGLAEQVIEPAIELARAAGASLCLLRVVKTVLARSVDYPLFQALPFPVPDPIAVDDAVASARAYLADVAARIRAATSLEAEIDVVAADHVAPALIDAAWAHHADVVAIATHGRGVSRFVLGSVADKVLRAGPPAVLLFHPVQD